MHKGKIHDAALKQICDLAKCTKSSLEIKARSVQQQSNSFDCGLFSVALLVDSLDGNNNISQNYNVEKMRFHFLTCLKMEFSVRSQEEQKEVKSVLQQYCLLMSTVFVVDHFSNMR